MGISSNDAYSVTEPDSCVVVSWCGKGVRVYLDRVVGGGLGGGGRVNGVVVRGGHVAIGNE